MADSRVSPSHRRWLRFRLRTLLVLVTGLCLALALWVTPRERQRRAVRAITDACDAPGTMLKIVRERPLGRDHVRWPRWLRNRLRDDYFADVRMVRIADTLGPEQLTDERFVSVTEHLAALTKLEALSVNCAGLTDAAVAHVPRLPNLTRLDLSGTALTDAGLEHLKDFDRLDHLDLSKTRVTDAGLTHLHGLHNLRVLRLLRTRVTATRCRELQWALPYCRIER